MTERRNLVPFPPSGLVIALGYWAGDVDQALRLARLIGAIEPRRRDDVVFAFCPRFDVGWDAGQQAAFMEVGRKLGVCRVTQRPPHVTGHPDAPYAMFASTLGQFAEAWRSGQTSARSVFFIEADGCPLKRDWLDLLLAEHERALCAGKRVTGALMRHAVPHCNGSLVIHLSTWFDRPSLHATPAGQAWDMFHAAALMQEAHPTTLLYNPYGATSWSDSALVAMAHDTAYLLNTKDDSAVRWAERTLVARAAPELGTEEPTPASGPRRIHVRG